MSAARQPDFANSSKASAPQWRQFQAVNLTIERLDELHDLVHATLSHTISEFVKVDGKPVDKTRWRYVRSEGKASAYYDRHPGKSQLPSLLIAGTLRASLEDVMEGLYMENSEDTRMVQQKINSRFLDAQVLRVIEKRSDNQPFAFTGLKWSMIKSSSSGMSTNRDLCYLEKLGTIDISGNRKLGFFIRQSVDLPEFPPLPSNKAIRAQATMCYLFEELGEGTIGMYMRGTMDSQAPSLLRKIALRSFAELSLSIGSAVTVAHAKRYARLIKTKRVNSSQQARSLVCEICFCLPSFFDHHQECAGCNTLSVCKRCRVRKSIFRREEESSTRLARATFCLGCVTNVRKATLPARDSYEDEDKVREPGNGSRSLASSLTESLTEEDKEDSQRSLDMFSLRIQQQLDQSGFTALDATTRLTGLQSLGSGHLQHLIDSNNSDDEDSDSVHSLDGNFAASHSGKISGSDQGEDTDRASDVQSIHLVRRSLQPPEMLEARDFNQDGRARRRPYANSYSETPALHQQRQLLSRLVKASQQTLQLTREQTRIAQRHMERSTSDVPN